MSQYQYSPLRKDRDEFRLLSLLPGPITDEIEIEIFHAPRDSKYEALSYVWGPPERTDVALVRKAAKPLSKPVGYLPSSKQTQNSKPSDTIGITHNLAVALRDLRDPANLRVLWIDAICINQDDPIERSEEVLEMGSVFNRAEQVIVWLGPDSEDSWLAIETLSNLRDGLVYKDDINVVEITTGSWVDRLKEPGSLKFNRPRWFAIRDLLRREWFSRV